MTADNARDAYIAGQTQMRVHLARSRCERTVTLPVHLAEALALALARHAGVKLAEGATPATERPGSMVGIY